MTYLFLGERRSARARQMGVSWEDGRLSARPLFNALAWHGIDPKAQRFDNLFAEGDGALLLRPDAAAIVAQAQLEGRRIIAMGNRVADQLRRLGIEHVKIRHPAALGGGKAHRSLCRSYRRAARDLMSHGGKRPGAGRPRQNQCKRGHSLDDPANVYIASNGKRACRACMRIHRAASERRKKEERPP